MLICVPQPWTRNETGSDLCSEQSPCSRTTAPNLLLCRRLPAIVGRISAARDDDFMAFPGMEANSITPPFEPIFPDHSFSKQNPVSRAMNTILEMLTNHSMIETPGSPRLYPNAVRIASSALRMMKSTTSTGVKTMPSRLLIRGNACEKNRS